ncbi:hypothetical protein QYE76_043811 [Lolium multiflorum]|uniref:Reverse transcriptase Ty1/copia-type domain-containing protein n=1 Tax=Lolium multiflorum TaxID=4521 RepID=A0AAD8TJE6_LOLMU|nr:hypothetical protein QYE76_043811 [Lolium multiflorum]
MGCGGVSGRNLTTSTEGRKEGTETRGRKADVTEAWKRRRKRAGLQADTAAAPWPAPRPPALPPNAPRHCRPPLTGTTAEAATTYNMNPSCHIPLPKSYRGALKDPHWHAAMVDEFTALQNNRIWDLVPRPPGANIVSGKWIFRHKLKPDGSLDRYKARWVLRGFTQRAGVDYGETFSPVVKPAAVRTVLSIAVAQDWLVHQLDINNAFLHGTLAETVYCAQPSGFVDASQPTMYDASTSLSMGLSRRRELGTAASPTIFYDLDLLSKLGTTGTPVADPSTYRSLVGALQYLSFTRPDVAYAVQQVCLYMHGPREPHLNAVKRILRYLRGTVDYGLQLHRSSPTSLTAYTDVDWAGCPDTRKSIDF